VLLKGVEGVGVQLIVATSRDHTLDKVWVIVVVLLLAHLAQLLSSMPGDCGQLTWPPMMTSFPEEVVP
jgi:hypothetical protein